MLSSGQRGWLLLLFVALMLMTIGFGGTLGQTIAIVFCPKYVEIIDEIPVSATENMPTGSVKSFQ